MTDKPTPYALSAVAELPGELLVFRRADVLALVQRVADDQWSRAVETVGPAVMEATFNGLEARGMVISRAERAALMAKSAEADALRAVLDTQQPTTFAFPDRLTVDIASVPAADVSIKRDQRTGAITGATVEDK